MDKDHLEDKIAQYQAERDPNRRAQLLNELAAIAWLQIFLVCRPQCDGSREDAHALAEDLTQKSVMAFIKTLPGYSPKPGTGIMALLRKITNNRCLEYFRGQKAGKRGSGAPVVSIDDLEREPSGPRSDVSIVAECSHILSRRAADSPKGSREKRDEQIFRLYYVDGLTVLEIASKLLISVSQVDKSLRRIRDLLRNEYNDSAQEDPGELVPQ